MKSMISFEAAQRLAVAVEKARDRYSALEIMTMLAANLGLNRIGTINEFTEFKPIIHQDVAGGLVPGDRCQITAVGWSCDGEVAVRALVM